MLKSKTNGEMVKSTAAKLLEDKDLPTDARLLLSRLASDDEFGKCYLLVTILIFCRLPYLFLDVAEKITKSMLDNL
jgi:hypothetical protein